jgi:hypothetical protein
MDIFTPAAIPPSTTDVWGPLFGSSSTSRHIELLVGPSILVLAVPVAELAAARRRPWPSSPAPCGRAPARRAELRATPSQRWQEGGGEGIGGEAAGRRRLFRLLRHGTGGSTLGGRHGAGGAPQGELHGAGGAQDGTGMEARPRPGGTAATSWRAGAKTRPGGRAPLPAATNLTEG